MLFNYAHLFELYKNRDRDGLIVALLPALPRWARDVLNGTKQELNYSFEQELVSAGALRLIKGIDKRLSAKSMQSGEHLVNSLRVVIRKAMKKAHLALFVAPPAIIEKVEEGDDVDTSKVTAPKLRTRVPMSFLEDGHPDNRWPDALVCQDRGDEKHRFLQVICRIAVQEASGVAAKVVDKLLAGEKSVSAAARAVGVPRETGRDSVKRLSKKFIGDVSADLKELDLGLYIAI